MQHTANSPVAEVRTQVPLWRVTVTEYEAGWGQRPCPEMTKVFDNEQQAREYATTQNAGGPEYYWRADVRRLM